MIKLTERDHYLMEAAQCIWEHILEQTILSHHFGADPWWDAQQKNLGLSALRCWARNLAPVVQEAYEIALVGRAELGEAYDAEFIPWFVDNCVTKQDINYWLHPELDEDWKFKVRFRYWRLDLDQYLDNRFGVSADDVRADEASLEVSCREGFDWREIADQAVERFNWEELPTYRPAVVVGRAK